MLPKQIRQEAAKYANGDSVKLSSFIAGAMFATTGKYYVEGTIEEETIIGPTFDEWWKLYSYKQGKAKTLAKWNKLTMQDRIDCMKATPNYVKNTVIASQAIRGCKKQYRMLPLTYLNGRRWEDEIYPTIDYEQQHAINLATKAARIIGVDYQG